MFYFLCIATFLGFTMTTTQALLPIVLEHRGVSGTAAGFAIASTAFSALLAGLASARLMARYGTPSLMYCSMVIMFSCHIGLEFLSESFVALFFLRLIHGLGTGIFIASALTFVKGRLTGSRTVSLFGIYASMIPGAFLVGPPLGELYLSMFGEAGYFLITAAPGALSIFLLTFIWLNHRSLQEDFKPDATYREVLFNQRIRLPLLCLILAGIIWGYVVSFLPYALSAKGLSGSLFLLMSTIGLFITRFLISDQLRNRDHGLVSGSAVVLMALSLLVLPWFDNNSLVAAFGVIFGMSYALAYPFISIWVLNLVDKSLHHVAIALINTVFNFFMFIAPLFVAFFVEVLEFNIEQYQIFVSTISVFMVIVGFIVFRSRSTIHL